MFSPRLVTTMTLKWSILVWFVAYSLHYIHANYVLYVCLVGNDVTSPLSLQNVTICGRHEKCFLEQYISPAGEIRYEAGCRQPTQCGGSVVRSPNIAVCSQCCSGDLCAVGLCGGAGYDQYSGPVCYDCSSAVDNPDSCGRIKQCRRDEVCGSYMDRQNKYVLQCTEKSKCEEGKYTSSCSTCCTSKLCNSQCNAVPINSTSKCHDSPNCHELMRSYISLNKDLCTDIKMKYYCNHTCSLCPTTTSVSSTTPTSSTQAATQTITAVTSPTNTHSSIQTAITTSVNNPTMKPTHTTSTPTPTPTSHTNSHTTTPPSTMHNQTLPTILTTPNIYHTTSTAGASTATTQLPSTNAPTTPTDSCKDTSDCHIVMQSFLETGRDQYHFCRDITAFNHFCNKTCGLCSTVTPQHMSSGCNTSTCIHGACMFLTNGSVCSCDKGYAGPACDKEISDCMSIKQNNVIRASNDLYLVSIDGHLRNIRCDMTTDNGGWTVLMNRISSAVNFTTHDYSDYAVGFGDLRGNFWLGLEAAHALTSDGRRYELRVDITSHEGVTYKEIYSDFSIGPPTDFVLHVGQFSGSAGDSLSGHSGIAFSTAKVDHDTDPNVNCAQYLGGAWWFHSCADSCLTCDYKTPGTNDCQSMFWNSFKYCTALMSARMMFRPM